MVDEHFENSEFILDLNWNLSPDFEYLFRSELGEG